MKTNFLKKRTNPSLESRPPLVLEEYEIRIMCGCQGGHRDLPGPERAGVPLLRPHLRRDARAPQAPRGALPRQQAGRGQEEEEAQRHHGRRTLHLMGEWVRELCVRVFTKLVILTQTGRYF